MPIEKPPKGAFTALVTPLTVDGKSVDFRGLRQNVEFQIAQGIVGLVPVGTTGESCTLSEKEHCQVIEEVQDIAIGIGHGYVLAGCGSNNVNETRVYAEVAHRVGCEGMLIVDPYYNGPSSLEIVNESLAPLARIYHDMAIIPYVIPGRTGCVLHQADLAWLAYNFPNICGVKEATGDENRMKETRQWAPDDFLIFSGDDDKTVKMMTDPAIMACGVISVTSNITPGPVQKMCQLLLEGKREEARVIADALKPLFQCVTVIGEHVVSLLNKKDGLDSLLIVPDKFRNPLAIKILMYVLGMPSGICRAPLGRMGAKSIQKLKEALVEVWAKNHWVLQPIQDFYKVDIERRIFDNSLWAKFQY